MKVLITTSGIGSRLKRLTQKTNKALIKIAGKPVIEYILDGYPKDTEFVITLGYLGSQVKNFLLKHYPDRKFSFAKVDKFQGPGSSLLYSLLCARKQLQESFIFHACDTITFDKIPASSQNWAASFEIPGDVSQYRTHQIKSGKIAWVNDKAQGHSQKVHIGLVGIKDYQSFWKNAVGLYQKQPANERMDDTFIINQMLKSGKKFYPKVFSSWYDMGNLEALAKTKKALGRKGQKYKVLILTSGTETRLGEITKYINKALVKVGKKPIISYIIDAYPKGTEFVITLGHFSQQVREFVELVYPRHKITLVEVDKYEGEGASQLYSMLCARDQLQCPFIYHACDTIVEEPIPAPQKNWVAGFVGEESSHYASFNVSGQRVLRVKDKGAIGSRFIHIGLIGVKDYQDFWQAAEKIYQTNPQNPGLNDSMVINRMIEKGLEFEFKEFRSWHDTGNLESLKKAREEIADSFHILDKLEESMFIIKDQVIKFFYDEKMVTERVKRAKILEGLVPIMKGSANNFYKYQFVKGNLYSEVANPRNFLHFLDWSQKYLWQEASEVSPAEFRKICYDFYHHKSMERIGQFLKTRGVRDEIDMINEEAVPTIKEVLARIDFDWLCNTSQSHFHGDFILDNIIKTKRGYCLLDWRQNFGGLYRAGDRYYDFAKLNHNLTVNHHIVNENLFTIKIKKNQVTCDILRKDNLILCQDILFHFLVDNRYDWKRVKVLTALIWLNMSPLHHHPFDHFLYYFGKLNLWRAVNNE